MASNVIHVGEDLCHRLPVLQSAGFQVQTCTSIAQIESALAAAEPPDAVLISESGGGAQATMISLVRRCSVAPVVLFRESQQDYAEADFDLVVPVLHPPAAWLSEIAELIAKCRKSRAASQELRLQSAALRRETSALTAKSRSERQRSRQEREREVPSPQGFVKGTEPSQGR